MELENAVYMHQKTEMYIKDIEIELLEKICTIIDMQAKIGLFCCYVNGWDETGTKYSWLRDMSNIVTILQNKGYVISEIKLDEIKNQFDECSLTISW